MNEQARVHGANRGARIRVERIVFPRAREVMHQFCDWPAEAEEGAVLLRTEYSLISPGTELSLLTGSHIDLHNPANRWAKYPFYPGYASVGTVLAVGRGVQAVRPGDRVLARGRHASHDRVACQEDAICRLPDDVPPEHALFARLAEISMSALIHSRLRIGDRVVVLGMGLIGNLAAQLYALQGVRPIGVDVSASRLEIAKRTFVQDTVLSGPGVDLAGEVSRLTGASAPDLVVEATGLPQMVNTALELVRAHGQVILLGSPRGHVEINAYRHIHSKGVALVGAHGSVKGVDGLPTTAELIRYTLGLIARRALAIEPLITHKLPSSRTKQAYDLLLNQKEHALGVILDWRSGLTGEV